MSDKPGLSRHDQHAPIGQSNATELPPELNERAIRPFAQGLAGFARWQTARDMHADLARAARECPTPSKT